MVVSLGEHDDGVGVAVADDGLVRDAAVEPTGSGLGVRLLAAAQATLTGWSELVAGDATRAEALLRAGYAEFEEMGEQSLLSGTAAELGRVLCKKGSYDEAEKFAATSEELSGPGDAFNLSLIAGIRARVLAAREQGAEAVQAAEEAVARSAGDCVELSADAYRALAVALRASHGAGGSDALRAFWKRVSAPEYRARERLFFEVYGLAVQRRDGRTEARDRAPPLRRGRLAPRSPPALPRAQLRGIWLHGVLGSKPGSRGRPSTRSPRMLRCT